MKKQSGSAVKQDIEILLPADPDQKETKLAKKLVGMAMEKLKAQYPELVYALHLFKLMPVENDTLLSTDFAYLYFKPDRVIGSYRKEGIRQLEQILLHILLHGFCLDQETTRQLRAKSLANLLCDIRIDGFMAALGYERPHCGETKRLMENWKKEGVNLSPENYHNLSRQKNAAFQKKWKCMQERASEWVMDDHRFWHMRELSAEDVRKITQNWTDANRYLGNAVSDKSNLSGGIGASLRGKENGEIQTVKKADGQAGDYRFFLERYFADSLCEENAEDEIDVMLYQYGFSINEDCPLVERADESGGGMEGRLCIAIDTSGSCEGEVIRELLREIGGLFAQWKSRMRKTTVHLITCDECIQSEKVCRAEDLGEDYFDRMELSGWGGTDFRPVFDRLVQLEKEHEKTDLLLYYTDGLGEYPKQLPDIKTVFVMSTQAKRDLQEYSVQIPKGIEIVTY